jgi:hypothetical protein
VHIGAIAHGNNPYHGSFGQQVGQVGQDALTLSTALPIGAGAKIAVKGVPLASKVAQGAKFGAKAGGGFGAAQGLSQSLQNKNNLKQTLKNVGINTAVGAAGGAALGAAAPVLGSAAKNAKPLNEVGAVGKNVKGIPKLPSEFNPKVTRQLTQNVPKDLGDSKNPLIGKVGVPDVQPGDIKQPHLNATYVAQHEQRVGQAAQSELAKLSAKDQNLMRGIQINGVKKLAPKAENPQQFVKTESALRNYYNLRHAYDRHLGIPTPYRQNYLRDLMPPQEPTNNFIAKGGNQAPGYTKAKTAPGATPVAEGLARDIAGSSFNHAKLTYAQGLEQAFPEQISRGSPIVGKDGVTQQLQTPYGNELFATKDLAHKINSRAPVSKVDGALGAYDKVNALAKYVKLSGGAFHAFTEAGNFVGQQLTSGKLFTNPAATGKVVRAFFSPKFFDSEITRLRDNGVFDDAGLSGLTWKPGDIKADVSVTPKNILSKYTGIKALHDATFQRELPLIKLLQFEQKTKGLDRNVPNDLNKMRSVSKGINQEIGGINRAIDGLTPKQARVVARGVLATDFTEGKLRTVVAALSKGGEEGKIAREVIAGKTLVFAALATGGAAATGELKGKTPEQVAQNIVGNLVNPAFTSGKNTVSFPATHISEFTKPFASFADGSKDKFYGLKHYASARLAAVPSETSQLVNNMDYSGNHIYGKNTKKNGGQPISGAGTALNVAKGVLPIPFSQGTSAVQGKQSLPATVGNIAGLRIYPTPEAKKTATGNTGNAPLSKGQQTANSSDRQQAWEHFTAKAKKNIALNNPDLYVKRQSAEIQKEQASGETTKAFKDQRALSKLQITRSYDKNLVQGYSLNATDFKAYLGTLSGDQVSKLQDLDAKLVDAGLVAKSKFTKSTGYASRAKPTKSAKVARSGKGSRGGSSRSSFSSAGFKTSSAKFKRPAGVKVKKLAAPSFKTKTRKLAVSRIPSSYKGKKI